ncbi:MAG: metallophosphoesterase family protein [Planctomycetota bacterium]
MRITGLVLLCGLIASPLTRAEDPPVKQSALKSRGEAQRSGLTNLFSVSQIADAIRDGSGSSLDVDLSHVQELLDGTRIDPAKLYGSVSAGPYPFESQETRYPYKRFRLKSTISGGKASIPVGNLTKPPLNSEGWTDRGQIAARFELYLESEGRDRKLGVYDTITGFKISGGNCRRLEGLLEGPHVGLLHSDDTSQMVITFKTRSLVKASVTLKHPKGAERIFRDDRPLRKHEITIKGLQADTEYTYRVHAGDAFTRDHTFRSAPPKGPRRVRFAFFGDSRAGGGGGMRSYMGINYDTLGRLAHTAYVEKADFLLMGGDLVNGYTTVEADFRTQLHAWKQAVNGFWNERPIYAAMGNHEALLRRFDGVSVDRWPYETQSAEAVFADTFAHPRNGPEASDHRRPSYLESVYSFQYGPVLLISFNNNYWYSNNSSGYGGCPEGYIMKDQMDWIVKELDRAEADKTVQYVLLFAQEPIFPNGGHLGDSMWYRGDNRVRAHTYRDGKLIPEEDGIIIVRNRFVREVAKHAKVAAVLGSDEHAFHRTMISKEVPIGDLDKDDRNRNAKIDADGGETVSTLEDLENGTWYVVCGGAGAPYYAENPTPWNKYWKDKKTASGVTGHYFSSQENVVLFDAGPDGISLRVLNPRGEVIDSVANLMADKR